MDRERLEILPFETLKDIAERSGIKPIEHLDKKALVGQILEALEEERSDRECSNNIEMLVKEKKFELNPDGNLGYPQIDEPVLPDTYGETRIVLMLRDPSWAFAYWDLSEEHLAAVVSRRASALTLRVHEPSEAGADGKRFFDIPLRSGDRKWYVNLPRTGRRYFAELVLSSASGEEPLCRSNPVESPESTIEDLSAGTELDYIGILSVAGIQDIDESIAHGGMPQRIISLLDTQYLHLKG